MSIDSSKRQLTFCLRVMSINSMNIDDVRSPYLILYVPQNRWHGHPIFPVIVALGGVLEIRSSWDGYLQEFRSAFDAAHSAMEWETGMKCIAPILGDVEMLTSEVSIDAKSTRYPISNFEAKYLKVGQPTYQLVIESAPMEICLDNFTTKRSCS